MICPLANCGEYTIVVVNTQLSKQNTFSETISTKNLTGFGAPAVDVCSICLQFLRKLKQTDKHGQKKSLMVNKKEHSLKTKAFFPALMR